MMFHFSSRTKLPTRLIACAALAIVGAAALSTSASASQQSKVVAACKKMGHGCAMTTSNGVVSGCTSVICFWCEKGKCTHSRVAEGNRYADIKSRHVERNRDMMSPGLLDGGGSLSTNAPSATGQAIGGGSRGGGAAGIR
jgi:hypothetical protein